MDLQIINMQSGEGLNSETSFAVDTIWGDFNAEIRGIMSKKINRVRLIALLWTFNVPLVSEVLLQNLEMFDAT